MAKKQVERRICDFCDSDAMATPCLVCLKDFCYAHGDRYTPVDRCGSRPRFSLCDACAKEFPAKLGWPAASPKPG